MRYTNDEIKKISNRNKKIKLIFKVIIYIIILPITIYNTYLLIMSYFKPNEIPSFFGIKSYEVISESMQPTLKIGDKFKGLWSEKNNKFLINQMQYIIFHL